MRNAPIEPAPLVDLVDNDSPGNDALEIELATTLLYGHCHYSYRQLCQTIGAAGETQRREIVDLGLRHLGSHDEMPRPFSAGQHFPFHILTYTASLPHIPPHR